MLRNYITTALRNLVRNRLYAAINIVGLAVGFSAVLLIALFVHDDLSYDRWIPGYDRVALVTSHLELPNRPPIITDLTPAEFGPLLKLEFPEIEELARLAPDNVGVRRGEFEFSEKIYWADKDFFSVIPLPVVAGELRGALDHPDGIVISRTIARKYFHSEDVVGQTLELNRAHLMTIMAVVDDLPSNTSLDVKIIASGKASFSILTKLVANPQSEAGYLVDVYTFLKLREGASVSAVQSGMPGFLQRHKAAAVNNKTGLIITLPVWPLATLHLSPGIGMKPRGSMPALYSFSLVAFLILGIVVLNFANLVTANANRRAVEVGVRKVSGAERRHLIVQFIGEGFLYAILGVAMALGLSYFLARPVGILLDRGIEFSLLLKPVYFGALVTSTIALAVLAGFYPAIVLSQFRPAVVCKGGAPTTSASGILRQFFMGAQFAALIGLIIATGTAYEQVRFALTDRVRLNTDQVLTIASCAGDFADRVRQLPGVRAAACSEARAVGLGGEANGTAILPNGSEVSLARASVDFGFFELFGFKPVAGRFFSPDHPSDKGREVPGAVLRGSLVINETAVRALGFPSAQAAIGQIITPGAGWLKLQAPAEIVGVVSDFALDPIGRMVLPTAYFIDPFGGHFLNVKLSGQGIPETLDAVDRLWKTLGEPTPIDKSFLNQAVEALMADVVRQSTFLAVLAAVSVFIAVIGLFGLSASAGERRTKEIGIRKAMGASRAEILRLLLWQFAKPVLWANLIAWPTAYFIMKYWLASFAYHIDLEPWVFVAASVLALVIAVVTVFGHALLVADSQPVVALRYE